MSPSTGMTASSTSSNKRARRLEKDNHLMGYPYNLLCATAQGSKGKESRREEETLGSGTFACLPLLPRVGQEERLCTNPRTEDKTIERSLRGMSLRGAGG